MVAYQSDIIVPGVPGEDTAASWPQQPDEIAAINRHYDDAMFRWRPGVMHEFSNYGYWEPGISNHQQACENLVEHLLAYIPNKIGRILDVACGKGATTRYLLNYYRPRNVVGINISPKQLQRCRENSPQCQFLLMNATELSFPDDSFDNIICIEAAFHFNTRDKFLRQAYRVLKPRGRLVLSDLLTTKEADRISPVRNIENFIAGPSQYRTTLASAGFERIRVKDATHHCWRPFYGHALQAWSRGFIRGQVRWELFQTRVQYFMKKNRQIRYYLLAVGQKPG